jgi:uncharacterized membrane protein YbhN (UPF0104 family)
VAILITKLPINIAGFGVRESAYVILFSSFSTKETLMALAILVFFVNHIIPLLVGLCFVFPFLRKLQIAGNKETFIKAC